MRISFYPAIEESNHRHRGLLRPRREGPRRRAAEERDELAPFHQQFLPCFEGEDSTAEDLLHCGISTRLRSARGQTRPSWPRRPHPSMSAVAPIASEGLSGLTQLTKGDEHACASVVRD